MALSDREQRLLDEIEQSLITDDPEIVAPHITGPEPTATRIAPVISVIGILIALGCIVLGFITATTVGVCVTAALVVLIVTRSWVALGAGCQKHPRPRRASN